MYVRARARGSNLLVVLTVDIQQKYFREVAPSLQRIYPKKDMTHNQMHATTSKSNPGSGAPQPNVLLLHII